MSRWVAGGSGNGASLPTTDEQREQYIPARLSADALQASFGVVAQIAPGVLLTNPRGLRRWSTALSDAVRGAAVVSIYGDSITKGVGSDGNAADTNLGSYRTDGWAGQLRALFAAQYGDTGEGVVTNVDGGGRWTFAGGAQASSSTGPFQTGGRATGPGQTVTVTTAACTQIDVWIWDGSSSTAGYTIDGGARVAIATPGGSTSANSWTRLSITGLPDTPHTVVFDGLNLYLGAVVAVRGTSGVHVHQFGRSGATTANLVGEDVALAGNASGKARVVAAAAKVPQSHLLVLALGVNDFGNQNNTATSNASPGASPTTYRQHLQTIVNSAIANGACVLLLGEPRQNPANYPNPMTHTEADYYAQAKAIAESTDHCAFLDIGDLWGTNAQGQALGLYTTSSVHPRRPGHGSIARLVHRALTTPIGQNAATA